MPGRMRGRIAAGVVVLALLSPVSMMQAEAAPAPEPVPDPCPSLVPGRGARGCLPGPDRQQLPNLAPMAPWYVDIGPKLDPVHSWDPTKVLDSEPREQVLRFTTEIVNFGDYALDIFAEPVRERGDWIAHQCVAWLARICLEREEVGEMVFHADHSHWHFEEFALYELRRLDDGGEPDWSESGLVTEGKKASFCLQDSRRREGDEPRFYRGCVGVLQGISPGWSDIYGAILPGQNFPLDVIEGGERYALVYTANPAQRLLEVADEDNVAYSVIEISEDKTDVEIIRSSGP